MQTVEDSLRLSSSKQMAKICSALRIKYLLCFVRYLSVICVLQKASSVRSNLYVSWELVNTASYIQLQVSLFIYFSLYHRVTEKQLNLIHKNKFQDALSTKYIGSHSVAGVERSDHAIKELLQNSISSLQGNGCMERCIPQNQNGNWLRGLIHMRGGKS